jgi:hypothetical protein
MQRSIAHKALLFSEKQAFFYENDELKYYKPIVGKVAFRYNAFLEKRI